MGVGAGCATMNSIPNSAKRILSMYTYRLSASVYRVVHMMCVVNDGGVDVNSSPTKGVRGNLQ